MLLSAEEKILKSSVADISKLVTVEIIIAIRRICIITVPICDILIG
jgi:H2-forming N5,N10-methylenetetrahydromethanopterin dehydrogenase-like enzyme